MSNAGNVAQAITDPRMKSTYEQVRRMNRWFDSEKSDYQLRSMTPDGNSRPTTAGAPGQPKPHAGGHLHAAVAHKHGGHLVVNADLGWMVGSRQDGKPSGPPKVLAAAKISRPTTSVRRPRCVPAGL